MNLYDNTHALSVITAHICRYHTCIHRLIQRHNVSPLTPKQVEIVRVQQLEAKEGKNDLKGERSTIHKVPIEQLNSVVKHYDAQVLDSRLLLLLSY